MYGNIWGVEFSELRAMGFRPLIDQAWAGVKTLGELASVQQRADEMGLATMIPLSRGDLHVRFRYTFDLSALRGAAFGFRWSLIAFSETDPGSHEHRPGTVVQPDKLAAYGFFPCEADAVAWKLIVT